jgi:hypothetical protein
MTHQYVGPHDAVDLVGVGTVKQGETVTVTGAAAKSLDEQKGAWKRVAPKTRKPRTAADDQKTED